MNTNKDKALFGVLLVWICLALLVAGVIYLVGRSTRLSHELEYARRQQDIAEFIIAQRDENIRRYREEIADLREQIRRYEEGLEYLHSPHNYADETPAG